MSQPALLSSSTKSWFAHTQKGDVITRPATCLCGRQYVQYLLSERVLLAIERRGQSCMAELTRQIPEFYVPLECPSCERRQLTLEASRAAIRTTSEPRGDMAAD